MISTPRPKIPPRVIWVRFSAKSASLSSMRMRKASHALSSIVMQFLIKVRTKVGRIYLNVCIGLRSLLLAIWCAGIVGACWKQSNSRTVGWRRGRRPTKHFSLWTTQKMVVGYIVYIKQKIIIIYRVFILNC
jgi:hypothetical protein